MNSFFALLACTVLLQLLICLYCIPWVFMPSFCFLTLPILSLHPAVEGEWTRGLCGCLAAGQGQPGETVFANIESSNNSGWKESQEVILPKLLPKAGPGLGSDQVIQDLAQTGLESFQRWRLHNICGKYLLCLTVFRGKKCSVVSRLNVFFSIHAHSLWLTWHVPQWRAWFCLLNNVPTGSC